MINYLEKYPNSDYRIEAFHGPKMAVVCPVHGLFMVTKTNFFYHRGCMKCRGVHPRAYPIGARSQWPGHPVFVNEISPELVEASLTRGTNVAYGVSYSDKRVAEVVAKLANRLLYSRDFEIGRDFMDLAHDVKIPLGGKRDRNLRFVEKWPGHKLLGIGEKRDDVVRIVPMRNGLIAHIVHHVVSQIDDFERVERILFHAAEIK